MATIDAPQKLKELKVGVILYERVTTLDWVGPTSYIELLPMAGFKPQFITISDKTGRIQNAMNVALHSEIHYANAPEDLDILVIPGGLGSEQVIKDKEFIEYIKRVSERASFVLSVCTGSSILAATGLLDGKRATTNKMLYNAVVTPFPNVNWVTQARWVVDGKFWTSSGVAAGLDMGHAFIRTVYGEEHADQFAHILEIQPNRDASNDPFTDMIGLNLTFEGAFPNL